MAIAVNLAWQLLGAATGGAFLWELLSVRPKTTIVAHKMVASTAEAIALAAWEEMVRSDNSFYRRARNGPKWARKNSYLFLEAARRSLADCLVSSNLTEEQKEYVAEALAQDHSLRLPVHGRA